ncbi:hypothetical protein [Cryptosporangium japonicum]|uniref:Uncharacterized protein n=1 Tax=Cryptosporangium japonicum TaxID=80872 RepID=A0ABN0U8E6_9ACTN
MAPIVIEEISVEDFNRIFAGSRSPEFDQYCHDCGGSGTYYTQLDDED